jgi:hypothetical protein
MTATTNVTEANKALVVAGPASHGPLAQLSSRAYFETKGKWRNGFKLQNGA